MDAGKITSGIFAVARIPTGTTSTTVATGDRGLPSGGSADQVLRKTSGTNYAVEWGTRLLPLGNTYQNDTLTTINVPDGTTTTSGSFTLTAVSGQTYILDMQGVLLAYGDLGTNAESTLRLEVTGTTAGSPYVASSASYMYVQGVRSSNVYRKVLAVTTNSTSVTITLKHIQTSGVYTLRMQLLAATMTPYNSYY